MRAPNDDATPRRSLIARILVRPAAYRHPRAYGGACLAAGLWVFFLGVILCAYGFWWGAPVIVVGALELWVAHPPTATLTTLVPTSSRSGFSAD